MNYMFCYHLGLNLMSSLTLSLSRSHTNSPYCLPYSSYDVSLENLVLDKLTIP